MIEVSLIFSKGSIISTNQKDQTTWVPNLILNFNSESNSIEIPLKSEYRNDLLMIGKEISIKKENEHYIYIAKCTVEDIIMDYTQILLLKIQSVNEVQNKRQEARFDVKYNCLIKSEEFEDAGFSIVVDISKSGIGILSRQVIKLNSEIFIDVLYEDDKVIKLKGVPVRKITRGYNIEYGIKTHPVDEENKQILLKVLNELNNNQKKSFSMLKKIRNRTTS